MGKSNFKNALHSIFLTRSASIPPVILFEKEKLPLLGFCSNVGITRVYFLPTRSRTFWRIQKNPPDNRLKSFFAIIGFLSFLVHLKNLLYILFTLHTTFIDGQIWDFSTRNSFLKFPCNHCIMVALQKMNLFI